MSQITNVIPPPLSQQPQQPQDTTKRLQHAVRSWVHYDNLVNTFNKQAQNARSLKSAQEKDIQDILLQLKQQRAVIEVNGARLQFQQKESKSNLSWSWLDEQLHKWYSSPESKGKGATDLIKYLQAHRTLKIQETLEKL
jgi:hypothetical protein